FSDFGAKIGRTGVALRCFSKKQLTMLIVGVLLHSFRTFQKQEAVKSHKYVSLLQKCAKRVQ
ncbi:MAG: hypothetical protein ACKOCH_03800, partial [Bacteroidota bacterium]